METGSRIGCELAERSFFMMEMDLGARIRGTTTKGFPSRQNGRGDTMLPSPVARLTEEPLSTQPARDKTRRLPLCSHDGFAIGCPEAWAP